MSNELQLGPPPVEPLSDVAWARVERGLFARMDTGATPVVAPPSRRWLWIATPMLAAAAAVALWIGLRSPAPQPTLGSDPLFVIADASPSTVSFGDAYVTLEAHSKVVLSREAPTAMVDHGAAWFQVAPRHEQPPFVVVAGDTVVRVIGTRFKVGRYAEITTVAVERGLVDVRFRGVAVQVGAGQTWSSDHPNAISATTRTATAAEPAPVKATPAASEPAPPPTTDETEMAPTPVRPRPRAKPVAPPTPGTSQAAPAVDPDQTKFNAATALERRDPKAALAAYMELSQGNGKWAANALYAAGRLAMDLRDPRAQTFLTIYLRRFPKGKNADDARKLLEGEHR